METTAAVRLPNYAELQEVSSNVAILTPLELKKASFPNFDLGIYRVYWTKEELLAVLQTNRQKLWP
jgi:hypothetical protein